MGERRWMAQEEEPERRKVENKGDKKDGKLDERRKQIKKEGGERNAKGRKKLERMNNNDEGQRDQMKMKKKKILRD